METEIFSSLFNTLGVSGIFVAAAWYLMRRMEEREQTRATDARAREERLLQALNAEVVDRRETMAATLKQSTEAMASNAQAMHHVARALEDLPCRRIDAGELEESIIKGRRTARTAQKR